MVHERLQDIITNLFVLDKEGIVFMENTQQSQQILRLAITIGEMMLQYGGETYRTQETIERVLIGFGVDDFNVFVITNGIMASMNEERPDRSSIVRNVPMKDINLEKIALLNQLARDISLHECSLEEAWRRLDECKRMSGINLAVMILVSGLGAASACYVLGGRFFELVTVFVLSMLLAAFLWDRGRKKTSKYVAIIAGSLIVTVLSGLLSLIGVPFHTNLVVDGAIILLVPGISLASAIRDYFMENYLAGTVRLIDALVTGSCIAVGVAAGMFISNWIGGIV